MYVIRPITINDLETYVQYAFTACLGMASMPKNRDVLKRNIQDSLDSLSREIEKPVNEFYLFVIENKLTGQVGGICGIYSKIGVDSPYYYYRMETLQTKPYENLPIPKELHVLKPFGIINGPSEICSLYLAREFRKEGLGRLLSLSRLLFMACFPNRFEDTIVAEMRGYVDKNNTNPFWEKVGSRFLNIQYVEILRIQEEGRKFAANILPQYPIYVELMPQEAQDVIGKVHNNTKPALNMLLQEGFELTHDYDIFDTGPKIEAKKESIRTIQESKCATVEEIVQGNIESESFIVCNCRLNFRACISNLKIDESGKAVIPAQLAEALLLQPGDIIRYVSPSPVKA